MLINTLLEVGKPVFADIINVGVFLREFRADLTSLRYSSSQLWLKFVTNWTKHLSVYLLLDTISNAPATTGFFYPHHVLERRKALIDRDVGPVPSWWESASGSRRRVAGESQTRRTQVCKNSLDSVLDIRTRTRKRTQLLSVVANLPRYLLVFYPAFRHAADLDGRFIK